MKVIVDSEKMKLCLQAVRPGAVSAGTEPPSVLFEVSEKIMRLRSSDLFVFAEGVIQVDEVVEKTNHKKALVLFNPLDSFVQAQTGPLQILIDDKHVKIVSKRSTATVKTMEMLSFPTWPDGKKIKFLTNKGGEIIDGMRSVSAFASLALMSPELYNVHIMSTDKGIVVEAADGHRVGRMTIDGKVGSCNEMIAAKVAPRLPPSAAEKIKCGILSSFVVFSGADSACNWRLFCRTSSGNYPVIGTLLPKKFKTTVTVLGDVLANAVVPSVSFSEEDYRTVKLSCSDGKLTVVASTEVKGTYKTVMKAVMKGGPVEILADAKHLLEFIPRMQGKKVTICLNGPYDPYLVKREDDTNFYYLLWPQVKEQK